MKLNEKLMKIRKENGLSQEEFGNEIKVSRQAVSKWELGETKPDIDKIQEISKRFNISFDYLLNDEIDIEEKIKVENTKKKNKRGILKVILGLIVIYGLISLYKFIVLYRFYKIADSFSEENYWMNIRQSYNEQDLERDVTKIGNQKLIESYQGNYNERKNKIPYEIEFVDSNEKIAYILNYNEEENKYIYRDRKEDTINDEEWNDILDINKEGIKDTTLQYIPSSFFEILKCSINPTYFISLRNREIYANHFGKAKIYMELNNDYLVDYYILQTEFGKKVEINFSYDYVQDHFKNLENPLETYKEKILYDESEINGIFYMEDSYATDAPCYVFKNGNVNYGGNDGYEGTYICDNDIINIKYNMYYSPDGDSEKVEKYETLRIIDKDTLKVEKTFFEGIDLNVKYIKNLYGPAEEVIPD